MAPNEVLLINEPDPDLALLLAERAMAMGSQVKFVTQNRLRSGKDWIQLGPRHFSRSLQLALPKRVSAFVNLDGQKTGGLTSLVKSVLPSVVTVKELHDLVRQRPAVCPGANVTEIRLHLDLAAYYAEESLDAVPGATSLVDIAQGQGVNNPFTIVDWNVPEGLDLQGGRIQPEKLFKGNRSYLLVGLTGELGQSICQWMARCGAGTIILASRGPCVDRRWIKEVEALGSRVEIMDM